MNDQEKTPAQEVEPQNGQSPGQQLKIARETLGLSQQQVADRLHLRLNSIETIETDGIEQGVSITFTKGYVRLYAKLVNLDVAPLLVAFEKIHAGDKKPAKLQSFSRRVEREANDNRWNMVTYIVVILVIASLGYWWYDQQDSSLSDLASDAAQQVRDTFEQSPDEPVEEEKLDSGPQITEENAQQLQSDQASNSDIDNSASSSLEIVNDLSDEGSGINSSDTIADTLNDDVSDTLVTSTDKIIEDTGANVNALSSAVADEVTDLNEAVSDTLDDATDNAQEEAEQLTQVEPIRNSSSAINTDGTVDMIFTYKQDCWLSVKDATGETLIYGTKRKGHVSEVSGIPPIKVNLCPRERVEIEYGRQLVDLSVFSRGSPVKLELPLVSQ